MLTISFTRTIEGMTAEQLHRTYRRIWARIGDGWDVPTLRACHPHSAAALTAIALRHREVAPEIYH